MLSHPGLQLPRHSVPLVGNGRSDSGADAQRDRFSYMLHSSRLLHDVNSLDRAYQPLDSPLCWQNILRAEVA